jgi:hypothetical protein
MSRLRAIALAAVLILTPAATHAQSPASPFDFARLTPQRDSFSVVAQGAPAGWQVLELERAEHGYVFRERTQLGATSAVMEVHFAGTGTMLRMRASGDVNADSFSLELNYGTDRATGTLAVSRPQGRQEQELDAAVTPQTIDDNALKALLPALPWADGAEWQLDVLVPTAGRTLNMTLRVTETASVTVPAGTFETFVAQLEGAGQPVHFFVTRAAPHRLVRVSIAAVDFLLAK